MTLSTLFYMHKTWGQQLLVAFDVQQMRRVACGMRHAACDTPWQPAAQSSATSLKGHQNNAAAKMPTRPSVHRSQLLYKSVSITVKHNADKPLLIVVAVLVGYRCVVDQISAGIDKGLGNGIYHAIQLQFLSKKTNVLSSAQVLQSMNSRRRRRREEWPSSL